MFRKKRSTDIGNQETVLICEKCTAKGVIYSLKVKVDDVMLRATGYKGRFQAYVKCDKCGKEIVLSEDSMSKEVFRFLYKKWNG